MSKHIVIGATLLLLTASAYCQTPPADEWIVGDDSSDVNITEPWPDDSLLMPQYPEAAARQDIEGEVVALTFVDKYGSIKKVLLAKEKPTGFGFGDVLEPALKTWHFTPAVRDSQDVGVWIAIKFAFRTRPDSSLVEPQGVAGKKISTSDRNPRWNATLKFIVVKPPDAK